MHSDSWQSRMALRDLGGKTIRVRHTVVHLGIEKSPHAPYEVFISLIPENILVMDILLGKMLQISVEFHLWVRVIKAVLWENTNYSLYYSLPATPKLGCKCKAILTARRI